MGNGGTVLAVGVTGAIVVSVAAGVLVFTEGDPDTTSGGTVQLGNNSTKMQIKVINFGPAKLFLNRKCFVIFRVML